MIKRYDLVFSEFFSGGGIGVKENGKYCEYDDYLNLEIELIRIKGQRDKLAAALKLIFNMDADNMEWTKELVIEALEEINKLKNG